MLFPGDREGVTDPAEVVAAVAVPHPRCRGVGVDVEKKDRVEPVEKLVGVVGASTDPRDRSVRRGRHGSSSLPAARPANRTGRC
jgi:hypothetical protein